jgi:glycosyltransferase involved in cell wall biosynthesis
MKIVHDIRRIELDAGGPVRAVLDLCGALAGAGHEVVLLTSGVKDAPAGWDGREPGKPRVVRLPPPRGIAKLYGAEAKAIIEKELRGADALHTHCVWDPCCVQLGNAARRAGVPYFLSTRGMLDDYCVGQKSLKKQVFLAVAGSRFLRGAAGVHCTADEELRQSSRFFPKHLGRVIPNLVDLSPFRNPPGPEEARARFDFLGGPSGAGVPTALFMGRLHPIKGIERLLHAAAELERRGRPVTVVLAGPGDEPYVAGLRTLAAELKIEQRVRMTGMVSGTLKTSLIGACDLFVLPSHHENFGIALIESLACRTPVVTTRGVKIWAELERSGGAVIAETDPVPLAEAIDGLAQDAAKREAMGELGRAWVLRFLDPKNILAQFEAMYAAGRGGSAAETAGVPEEAPRAARAVA